mmetsp:Transcript_9986/g.11453  ORF Transcript_9986/g.11453 Transcript_9986/m.11453 type:complete len:243 (+) Transcript_9986:57-785(+)
MDIISTMENNATTTKSLRSSDGTKENLIIVSSMKAKGMLSMMTKPLPTSLFDEAIMSSRIKRIKKRDKSLAALTKAAIEFTHVTSDIHAKSEFTLLYFGASYCKHSRLFTPKLAKFVQTSNIKINGGSKRESTDPDIEVSNLHLKRVQCVCIPDAATDDEIELFCAGTGFMYLLLEHENRNSIKTLCSISSVPTVVVVKNSTGRIITDWGNVAIEYNEDNAIEAWSRNESGAPLMRQMCTVS